MIKKENLLDRIKILEKSLAERYQAIQKLTDEISEKNQSIELLKKENRGRDFSNKKLEKSIISKEEEITILYEELINLRSELSNIKKSVIFRIMKRIAKSLDVGFPHGTKRGELKKTASASTSMILNDGFRSYSNAVKEKMKRKEFKLITPMEFSDSDKELLYAVVKKNKDNRLKIEPFTPNEIKSDKFTTTVKD